MHEVKINGSDLDYFRSIVGDALRGTYGPLTEVTVTVMDNGRLQFSTGDYATGHFGTPTAVLVDETTDREGFPPEGSGNPYATLSQGQDADGSGEDGRIVIPDSEIREGKATKNQRLDALESQVAGLHEVVRRAEHMLNVRLLPRT